VFFEYARKRNWVTGDPLLDVKIPSDRDAIREHIVTPEEELAHFEAIERLHAIYLKSHANAQPNLWDLGRLILDQGARPEEILAAKVWSFDPKARTLKIEVGKSRAARRTLFLTDTSMEILTRRAKLSSEWLFPSDRNPGHHLTQLGTSHDCACIEAGVSFVLYDFRHTFVTRRILEGTPLPVVAAILGHSGLRTIGRYVHIIAEEQKKAMEKAGRKAG
jgi:integrase